MSSNTVKELNSAVGWDEIWLKQNFDIFSGSGVVLI